MVNKNRRKILIDQLEAEEGYSAEEAEAAVDDLIEYIDSWVKTIGDLTEDELVHEFVRDQKYSEILGSPEFKHGMDIGRSFGLFDAYMEADRANEAGELQLWLEFHRPKSHEDWNKWEDEHGPIREFRKRWAKKEMNI